VRILTPLALMILLAESLGGGAYHGDGCDPTGALEPIVVQGPKGSYEAMSAQLAPGATDSWVTTLGAGKHYVLVAATGDVSLSVCRLDPFASHVCRSDNVFPVPEACLEGDGGNPGTGSPLFGPGIFVVYIRSVSALPATYAGVLAQDPLV
jgi:hypothetical protein